jgi:hypothetical protein
MMFWSEGKTSRFCETHWEFREAMRPASQRYVKASLDAVRWLLAHPQQPQTPEEAAEWTRRGSPAYQDIKGELDKIKREGRP